jgi:hypothetical protein
VLLLTLIQSLVASPNLYIICITISTSVFTGLTKTAVSSAYRDSRSRAIQSLSGESKPSSVAFCKTCCKVSIVSMNRYGNSGSPCFRPHLCLIHRPQTPLSLTEEEEEDSSRQSQLRHLAGNPRCCNSSIRYSHETELKAFNMSSFINNAGVFFLWYALARFLTYRKFSWMHRRRSLP